MTYHTRRATAGQHRWFCQKLAIAISLVLALPASCQSDVSCDAAQQACPAGKRDFIGALCPQWARQSTFWDNSLPADAALDGDLSSCIRTAAPVVAVDPNPQWFRVDLAVNSNRVGTVRIASDPMFPHALSYFKVWASKDDAPEPTETDSEWRGQQIPAAAQLCYTHPDPVNGPGQEEFEIECAKPGRYVFVTSGEAASALRLCSVEVYDHACESEPFVCGLGQQPITTSCDQCPGCMSCPAGTYSNEISGAACKTCPQNNGVDVHSPPGSTSVFDCEGYTSVDDDGTSYFELDQVRFIEATDSWELNIVYETSLAAQVSGLFLSKAGKDSSFKAKNFPCGVSPDRDPWLITGEEETLCCLKYVRNDYTLTETFLSFSDSLDLEADTGVCDGPEGSNALIGVSNDMVGASGNEFLDADGNSFPHGIRVSAASCDNEDGTGLCNTTITIPDSELVKISRPVASTRRRNALPGEVVASLADAREIFVGLFDLMPTGGSIVMTGSQQVSVVLSKTNFGGLSAFGSQSVDYTFLSFLNVRAHKVIDARDSPVGDEFFAGVEFMYDDSLSPSSTASLVRDLEVGGISSCDSAIATDKQAVFAQSCGPGLDFRSGSDIFCPVVSIPERNFGQVYIPLGSDPTNGNVNISFMVALEDADGLTSSLKVSLILSPRELTTWCSEDSKTTDLASLMVPTMIIGISDGAVSADSDRNWMPFEVSRNASESASAFDLNDFNLNPALFNQANGLHDGLLTLVLTLDPDNHVDITSTDSMEVFIEDIVTIHLNPGAPVDVTTLQTAQYKPSFQYNPATGDTRVEIPDALAAMCPSVDSSPSFFGCTHKHIISNKEVADDSAAYILGTSGAEAFMTQYLEGTTAPSAAQEVGAQFEAALLADKPEILDSNTVACWINPGHKWGTDTPSVFSLSQNVLVYVLYGVKAGVGGPVRRMLVEASGQTASGFGAAVHYPLDTAVIVAAEYSIPEDLIMSWSGAMKMDQTEACLPDSALKPLLEARLMELMNGHSSGVHAVKVLSLERDISSCSQRRSKTEVEVRMEVVVALEEGTSPFIDWQALEAMPQIVSMAELEGSEEPVALQLDADLVDQAAAQDGEGSKSDLIVILVTSLGGIILCLIAWVTYKRLTGQQQDTHVLSTQDGVTLTQVQIEGKIMCLDEPNPPFSKPPPFVLSPSGSNSSHTQSLKPGALRSVLTFSSISSARTSISSSSEASHTPTPTIRYAHC